MRYSHQREEILSIVQASTLHPTADNVYDEARKKIPNISLGTVYRNLNQLVEKGFIRSIHDGHIVRYDGIIEPHDHFTCTNCNQMYDIQRKPDESPESIIQTCNHTVTDYTLSMTGVCSTCNKELVN